jgi:hypothetical protein
MKSAYLLGVLDNLCETNKNTRVHLYTQMQSQTHAQIHTEEADDKEFSNFKLLLAQH